MRCTVCRDLDFRSLPVDRLEVHDTQLIKSRASCRGCRVLGLAVENYRQLTSESFFVVAGESGRNCTVGDRLTAVGDRLTSFEIFTTQAPSPWPSIPVRRLVAETGLSESCFDLAESWLRTCIQTHPECQHANTEGGWLPTRLLYVGLNCPPKLIVTTDQDPPPGDRSYVALSHCWGNHQPLRLLAGDLKRFQSKIPVDLLPKTFYDAISVTRRLGLEYIWIDSLCIIQDSKEDWKREATKMLQVYQNSTLTIVADAGENCSKGLVSQALRRDWRQSEMPEPGGLHLRRARLDFFIPTGFATHCPGREERSWVNARGWTFQERIIPPRKLHFGPYEMGWECRRMADCECAGEDPVEPGQRRENATIFSQFWEEVDHRNFSLLWMKLVEEYTSRQLSFASDMLPALAGIADLIIERHGATYLAGLWKENLAEMLLWKVDHGPSPARKHERYYAPSWTWASQVSDEAARIVFERVDDECVHAPGFRVLDAKCTFPDGNKLLPPLDGMIEMEASVAPVAWHPRACAFFIPGLERSLEANSDLAIPEDAGGVWSHSGSRWDVVLEDLENRPSSPSMGDASMSNISFPRALPAAEQYSVLNHVASVSSDSLSPAAGPAHDGFSSSQQDLSGPDIDNLAKIDFTPDQLPGIASATQHGRPHNFLPLWQRVTYAGCDTYGIVITDSERVYGAYKRVGFALFEMRSIEEKGRLERLCKPRRLQLV